MNRPKFNIDKFNILGQSQNKIFDYISLVEIRQYATSSKVVSRRVPGLQRYVVNRESISEFFRQLNPEFVYYNEKYILEQRKQYSTGMYQITDKTKVIVECI